jgi:hypothetical protein
VTRYDWPRMKRKRCGAATLIVAALVSLAACRTLDVLAPERAMYQGGSEFLADQVRVRLDVVPEEVTPPGNVVVTLTYENVGSNPVEVVSGYGCLSFASVYYGEHRIPFPATQYGCIAVVSRHELKPGRPLTMEWTLAIGGEAGLHVPSGTYRFVAELNTHRRTLERTFVVR